MVETQGQREERQERIARAALPRLSQLADELEAAASEVFEKRVAYEPDVGADVMALSFVTKQREHLRSVRSLLSAGLHRDALLIARTMIEGLGRLLWAFKRARERTERWLRFGAIVDWRQTLENERSGMVVDPREKAGLKGLVDEHGPNYYRDSARKAIEAAEAAGPSFKIPDNPWRNNWTDATVESMFDEVGAKYVCEGVYRDTSEWIHWRPRSILRAMEPAEWGVSGFAEEDWPAAVMALQLGCRSLLRSLEVLDRHFSLGMAERLVGLERTEVSILTDSLTAGR